MVSGHDVALLRMSRRLQAGRVERRLEPRRSFAFNRRRPMLRVGAVSVRVQLCMWMEWEHDDMRCMEARESATSNAIPLRSARPARDRGGHRLSPLWAREERGGEMRRRGREMQTQRWQAALPVRSLIERVGRPLRSAQHTALPMATRRLQGCWCSTHIHTGHRRPASRREASRHHVTCAVVKEVSVT